MENGPALISTLLILGIYFMPLGVAALRGHPNADGIGILNVFLGWTFLGWVAALVWSVSNFTPKQRKPKP